MDLGGEADRSASRARCGLVCEPFWDEGYVAPDWAHLE